MIEGVDYLGTGPTAAELTAAGKHFRLGYIDRPDSSLTHADIDALHAAGIDVGLIAEWGSMRMSAGAAAGSVDGARAKAALDALGAPAGTVVYFAADWDVQRSQYVPVEQYLAAAKPPLSPYRAGLYGGLNIVSHVQAAGTVVFFWQTYAWSLGSWAAGCQLQQYSNGQSIGGHAVDYDRALVADFGQWRAGTMPTTSPVPDGPAAYLVDVAAGGSAYYDLASTSFAKPNPMAALPGVVTYGTARRGDGTLMRAIAHPTGFLTWVGDNKCSNLRPKNPAPSQTVTVTGQGIKVTGPA